MLGASEYYSLGRGSTINYYTPQALQQLKRFYSAIKKESPRASTTTSFTSYGMTTSFATPWSSGLLSNIQTPVLFGIQSSVAVNNNASDDADEENELP
ncbi:hypothetical protein ES319_1Z178900v1 [Gossypium barbadense]|uniref:Uncharacterized protein n=2 Tax=Gossypium TaxID=3633 RepID=A0A5J5NCG5_GOSBA|nr:hypothetical protein ES319_1Z178900v1 [Gossypium barbadense]TYH24818.1 hypothetical protein ES288_A03G119800v1 [Gossypium darwinii]